MGQFALSSLWVKSSGTVNSMGWQYSGAECKSELSPIGDILHKEPLFLKIDLVNRHSCTYTLYTPCTHLVTFSFTSGDGPFFPDPPESLESNSIACHPLVYFLAFQSNPWVTVQWC